jgi:hypothetical protein
MWSKFDDQFYMNPKIASLGRDEQDLYIAAIIYCNGQLTDGFIPAGAIPMLSAWAKIEANAQAIAYHLLEAGLWENSANGYQIHDFLDWNMSKADVLAMKAARSEAGKRGGLKSVAKRQASASASAQAKLKQNSTQSQSLVPEVKKPVAAKKEVKESADGAPLFEIASALAVVCGMDFTVNKGQLFREAKLIAPKANAEYILAHYGQDGEWYINDWRGKKGERPTPSSIRQTIGSFNGGAGKEYYTDARGNRILA